MNKFLITIVKACWNDPLALNSIHRQLRKIDDENSVWNKNNSNRNVNLNDLGHNGRIKLIKAMFKKILEEYKTIFDKIDEKRKHFIT